MTTDYGFILGKQYASFKWSLSGDDYSGLNWMDSSAKPTKQELDKAYIDYKAANDYIDSRKKEYPTVDESIMLLWESMDSGEIPKSKAFYDAIKAVNDKHPKPS